MFYIKNNNNFTIRMSDSPMAWEVVDFPGKYWIGASNLTNNKTAMFETRTIAQKFLKNSNLNERGYYIVELKEEEKDMKLYGIQMTLDFGGQTLVSVLDEKTPLHTNFGAVAIVSGNPKELEHLVNMLPDRSFGRIVEVTMGENGKWVIVDEWKPEPIEKHYIYKLKGLSSESYLLVDEDVVALTSGIELATKLTRNEALDLSTKQGLKLTAFEEIEVDVQ